MKKFLQTVVLCVLGAGLLTGCGDSYETDESTVFVQKDGSIVSTDVEAFDENTYDTDAFTSYVEGEIDAYNEENGQESVELKELTVEDGTATLTIAYATASDYQKFNDIELYTGTVMEALSAGYSFDGAFASVEDGAASACTADAFFDSADEYKVVIIRSNTTVNVKGTIAYVSAENTSTVDENTVRIREGANILGTGGAAAETEGATETAAETESTTEDAEVSGAVSDDELLTATEESTEVVFEFEEETEDSETVISQVYTYIIYK